MLRCNHTIIASRFQPHTRITWFLFAVLICAVSWIFFSTLSGHLLDSHDIETFRDHIAISEDFSFFFSPDRELALRPADTLFKWLVFLIWGNEPTWYHWLCVGIHGLNALLLASLFRNFGLSLELSMMAGLLFLINVGHYEVIHWITALSYSMAMSCGFAALIVYVRFLAARQTSQYLAFCGFLITGLMFHPAIASLWLLALQWSWRNGVRTMTALRWLIPPVLLFACLLVLILPTEPRQTNFLESMQIRGSLETIEIILGAGRICLWLLSRLVTTAHWLPLSMYELAPWELWLGASILSCLAILIWKNSPVGSLAAFWILFSVLPFLLLAEKVFLAYLPAGPPRYLFIASAGVSLLLAWIITVASNFFSSGRYIKVVLLTALVFSSYFAMKKAEALSLYTSSRSYHINSDLKNAAHQLRRAIERGRDVLDQEDAQMRLCLLAMGLDENSDAVVDAALDQFPQNSTLRFYKLALESMSADSMKNRLAVGQIEAASTDPYILQASFRKVMAQAYHHLGLGFDTRDDFGGAVVAYRRALIFSPEQQNIAKRLTMSLSRLASTNKR